MAIKKYSSIIILFVLVISTFFSSCKKYPEGPFFSFRSLKTRVQGTYTYAKYSVGLKDSTGAYSANRAVFDKNGLVTFTSLYGNVNGTWTFNKHNKTMNVNYLGKTYIWEIKKLTNKEFWAEYNDGLQVWVYHLTKVKISDKS